MFRKGFSGGVKLKGGISRFSGFFVGRRGRVSRENWKVLGKDKVLIGILLVCLGLFFEVAGLGSLYFNRLL